MALVSPYLKIKFSNQKAQSGWTGKIKQKKLDFFFFFCLFAFSRAAPTAYGGYQAKGPTRAAAAGLHHNHSHSNVGSEPRLWPTPQLTAMLDP